MDTIATAILRLESAVEHRSTFGVGTNRAVTTLTDGLACSTQEGEWRIHADLPAALGGAASAPTPGALVRAAFGSCMAMSYRLRAAKTGVDLSSVRVTVEADSAVAGMLSCDATVPPGFTELRYHVEIESQAPRGQVEHIIDEGDRLSPVLDALARSNTVRRTTSIRTGET